WCEQHRAGVGLVRRGRRRPAVRRGSLLERRWNGREPDRALGRSELVALDRRERLELRGARAGSLRRRRGSRALRPRRVQLRALARWDGASWSPLGAGVDHYVFALRVHDDGSGPALYAAGRLFNAGGASANRIARWNGTSWSPLGSGTDDIVYALGTFDDGG